MRSYSLRLLWLISALTSAFVHATLVEFTFTGQVAEVENNQQILWDPVTTVGMSVSGHFILDTDKVTHGDLNTSWHWYSNRDTPPGALSSQFILGDQLYDLTSDFDEDQSFDEYISVSDGPGDEGGYPYGDGISLRDQENSTVEQADGSSLHQNKELRMGFIDLVNDLLHFEEGLQENIPPDFVQEFVFTDPDLEDDNQRGGGSFEYRTYIDGVIQYDSTVAFVLTQITGAEYNDEEPNEVPAPATALLMLSGALGLLALHRKHQSSARFHGQLAER